MHLQGLLSLWCTPVFSFLCVKFANKFPCHRFAVLVFSYLMKESFFQGMLVVWQNFCSVLFQWKGGRGCTSSKIPVYTTVCCVSSCLCYCAKCCSNKHMHTCSYCTRGQQMLSCLNHFLQTMLPNSWLLNSSSSIPLFHRLLKCVRLQFALEDT